MAMRERHENELEDLRTRSLQSEPKRIHSRELLNLRRIQNTLAKQKDYMEAHKVQMQVCACHPDSSLARC